MAIFQTEDKLQGTERIFSPNILNIENALLDSGQIIVYSRQQLTG